MVYTCYCNYLISKILHTAFFLIAEEVLSTVLGIYMEDTTSSLPTFEEVLLCNEKTTAEEVSLHEHGILL